MKSSGAAILLSIALLFVPFQDAHAATDDFLIVPGERIGVVVLGKTTLHTWPAVYEAHRIHPEWRKRGDVETMCWSEIGLCATFFLRLGAVVHTAIQVVTRNPRYHTQKGFRVGVTYAQAKRVLGQPSNYEKFSSGAVANWLGMEVEIVGGRVRSIAVGGN